MLQEKRDSAERDVERVTDGLGALAVGGTVADGVDPSLVVSALENLLGSLGSDVGNEVGLVRLLYICSCAFSFDASSP